MNLVQIQERLKDMPMQALMAYANGMNPEVPPYLALGELNRRKNMQQPMSQGPQGTVKDRIESEVGLGALQKQAVEQMQLNALRQQQMAQSQMGQAARQPMPIPGGVPQPEMAEMADGGIATINVPDNVMEYGSGGIVAFAGGELVEDVYGENVPGAQEYIEKQVRRREEQKQKEEKERDEFLQRVGSRRISPQQPAEAPPQAAAVQAPVAAPPVQQMAPPPVQRVAAPPMRPPAPPVQAMPAAPVAGIPAAQVAQAPPRTGPDFMQMLAEQAKPQMTYEQKMAAAAEKDPYLNKQPGGILENYIKQMQERSAAEQTKFDEAEKERTRAALWKSLISAGEATRGQRGIGALFGGFGKAAGEEMEAARGREAAQMKLRREQQDAIIKMQQEIENARIARSQGRFDKAAEHDEKAEDNRRAAITKGAEIQSQEAREGQRFANEQQLASLRFANDEKLAQIRFDYERRLKGIPQAERPSLEREYVAELVKAGVPRDKAIERAKLLGSSGQKGVMTRDQAEDNVRKDMENPVTAIQMKNEVKAALGREPSFTEIKDYFVSKQMGQTSGSSGGPKEGDTAKSNSGKPIIFRNGRWEYQ